MACAASSFEVGLHWRRSLEGEVQEVSEGVQFEMVPKCKHFVSLVSTFWLSSPMFLCTSYFSMIFCALVQSLCYSSALFVDEWERSTRHRVTLVMLYLADLFFQGSDALHVTAHFARPRGILIVAQPSNHQALHSAHHGWSHLLLHSATELSIGVRTNVIVMSYVTHKSRMWDPSVSTRTYVKHVLAYGNVSEQARKGFCVCDVAEWVTDGHTALLGCLYKTSTIYIVILLALYLLDLLY